MSDTTNTENSASASASDKVEATVTRRKPPAQTPLARSARGAGSRHPRHAGSRHVYEGSREQRRLGGGEPGPGLHDAPGLGERGPGHAGASGD